MGIKIKTSQSVVDDLIRCQKTQFRKKKYHFFSERKKYQFGATKRTHKELCKIVQFRDDYLCQL